MLTVRKSAERGHVQLRWLDTRPGRLAWLQVAGGTLTLNGQPLEAGDGAAVSDEVNLEVAGEADRAEALLFDLA
jgi:quercetin 2,3-dioxygenase